MSSGRCSRCSGWVDRLRRPALQRVGMGAGQTRRPDGARRVTGDLAPGRWPARHLPLPALGAASREQRTGSVAAARGSSATRSSPAASRCSSSSTWSRPGVFFAVPLFLSVVLELDALQTGLRILPLSAGAAGRCGWHPEGRPAREPAPRRPDRAAGCPPRRARPGRRDGSGCQRRRRRRSDAADRARSRCPGVPVGRGDGVGGADSESAEVGGVQNTATNLGASLGTALIGSVLLATLSGSVITGIQQNAAVPDRSSSRHRPSWSGEFRSCPTSSSPRRWTQAGVATESRGDPADQRRRPARRTPGRVRPHRRTRCRRPVLHRTGAPTAAGSTATRTAGRGPGAFR